MLVNRLNHIPCPGCGRSVDDRAPACPDCGEMVYVEHPGDIKGVKHMPLDLKPASKRVYRPSSL